LAIGCAAYHSAPHWANILSHTNRAIPKEPLSAMSIDLFLMLVIALGCAFIGWAVIYFVSESPTALNTSRRPFVSSGSAAESGPFGGQRKRGRIPRQSSIADPRKGLAAR
jgi:hypothetical protein